MSPDGPIDSLDPVGLRTVRAMVGTDVGSNWTFERLAELRRRSYGAAAWVDFLRQSLERSAEQRRGFADADRQLRRWMTAWALAALAAGRSRRAPKVSVRAELRLVAGTWLMVRWHLGMLSEGEATGRKRLSCADALTLTRLWLAPRLRRAASDPPAFVAILVLGAVTDVLDGRLARQRGTSRLGRDLDSLTDLVFFRAAGRAAREAGVIGQYPALAFELRQMLGPAYAVWHYFRFASPPMIPSRRTVRVAKAIALAGIAAAVARRKGDLAVLSGSAAATAVQVLSALQVRWAAAGAEPDPRVPGSKRSSFMAGRTESEW